MESQQKPNERVCVYPGSFDPFTNGHLDLLLRALEVFDRIIIGVLQNAAKRPHFSPSERIAMIERCIDQAGIAERCSVIAFSGLTVDFANEMSATAILRGLRAVTDFEYEWQMALMNRKLAPEVDTVFFMTDNAYAYLSSTMVRDLVCYGRDISEFVPSSIVGQVQEMFKQNDRSLTKVRCE